jgi:AraC-like DNA-binding protein
MSAFHFARVFRELSGTPPHQFLLSIRLREAARRLREGASVTEACYGSGFQNLSHFSRQFTRRFGVKPSLYAKGRPGENFAK